MGLCTSRPQRQDCELRGISSKKLSQPKLSDFVEQKSLGKGAFGKVRIVHHKSSQQLYALKVRNSFFLGKILFNN